MKDAAAEQTDDAVRDGLADQPESDEPKVIDVDVSSEFDDDLGVSEDAEVFHLPVKMEVSPPIGGMALVPVRDELKGLTELAVTLAIADNTPKDLKGKPAAVLAVFLTGRELGIPPMTALRTCHVIDGKVTVAPKVRAAMVRREGLGRLWPHQGPREVIDPVTGEVTRRLCKCGRDYPDNDADVCTWHAERADDIGVIYSSTYTMAMAGAVKTNNSGGTLAGKDNWKNYPERMLSWRSLGYLLDDAFPEVGTGLYSPDELGAMTDEEGTPIIDVDSTETLTERAQAERKTHNKPPADPPASPDTIVEFNKRIDAMRDYEGAIAELGKLWRGERPSGDPGEPLPKVENLLYKQCKTASAQIAMIERRIAKGDFKKLEPDPDAPKDEEGTDESGTDGDDEAGSGGADVPEPDPAPAPAAPESAPQTAPEPETDLFGDPDPHGITASQVEDGVIEEAPREPWFDPDELPTGYSTADDLAWAEVAPDEIVEEVVAGVAEIKADDLTGVLKLLDMSANGLNERTKRERIATRRVRIKLERLAGRG